MKTCLFEEHHALNAKFFCFHGWNMPLHYQGVIFEHLEVRNNVGLFDISHMGIIFVRGKEAEEFLDFLSTNCIKNKSNGSVTYTIWADDKGKSIDDVLIYQISEDDFFVVVNCSNREKDLAHLNFYAKNWDVHIQSDFENTGILALQGPNAEIIMQQVFPEAIQLKKMHFLQREGYFISRTGYTGEEGFEIFAPSLLTKNLWKQFLELSITPCGLAARDTLRLEMGYALYGNELSETIYASESVAHWAVKISHNFLGKEAMVQNASRYALGIILENGIPRAGYPVYQNEERIGSVTSGNFSPILKKGIALILSEKKFNCGDKIFVEVHGKKVDAIISSIPFIKTSA